MKNSILLLLPLILVLTGCGESTNTADASISQAIISEEHGQADVYTPERLEELKTSGKRFAVFVGADWCPGCVRLTKEILANQQTLPANTAILTANFDTDLELRREYGVTVKHTAIYFDEKGEMAGLKSNVLMQNLVSHLLAQTPL